jgi:succinate dehydrogenase flavin-adding protein (antitoxin of CptAB toxin-antitoxin module)
MNYYVTTKTDLLTPEQRKQFNDIIEHCQDSDFVDRLWDYLDHNVTDTLDDDGTERQNFRDDLAQFCFGWVMGEKHTEIEAKMAMHKNLKETAEYLKNK